MSRLSGLALVMVGCGRILPITDPALSSLPDDGGPTTGDPLSYDGGGPTSDDSFRSPLPDDGGPTTVDASVFGSSVLTDSVRDFSSTQGLHGWSYGYESAPGVLALMSTFTNGTWVVPSTWLALTAETASPNLSTSAVRRWTSSYAGAASVHVRLFKTEVACGDGVEGQLRIDGATAWTRHVDYADAVGVTADVPVTLAIGSSLDLVLVPGAGDGCDHAHLSALVVSR